MGKFIKDPRRWFGDRSLSTLYRRHLPTRPSLPAPTVTGTAATR